MADFRRISPDYLDTMGIALLRGRLLSIAMRAGAPLVILIDETLAHQYWPARRSYRPANAFVGRMAASRRHCEPGPSLWVGKTAGADHLRALRADADKAMALAVRTTMDTEAVVKAVKQAVWSVDSGQPVFQIRSMDDYMSLADTAPAHFDDSAGGFRWHLGVVGRAGNSWRGFLWRRAAHARIRTAHGAGLHAATA